jgi:hypothetical protein
MPLPPDISPPAAGGIELLFAVTLRVNGGVTGTASWIQATSGSSCSAYAQGASDGFGIPEGNHKVKMAGPDTALNVIFFADNGWHGPGDYDSVTFKDPATDGIIEVDDSSSNEPFQPLSNGAGQSLHVEPDGGGWVDFAGWVDAGGRTLNGAEIWVCEVFRG